MEALRDTNGSYIFTATHGESLDEAEPLSWNKLAAYFLTLVEVFELELADQFKLPAALPAADHFRLMENFDTLGESLGYEAVRIYETPYHAILLPPVAVPNGEIDLPVCELPGRRLELDKESVPAVA